MCKSLKRFIGMLMVVSMIFVQAAVASAQTLEESGTKEEIVYQGTYYDEDGELVKTTIKKITYPSARSGVYERVTYSKEDEYQNYSVALTATFSYNVTNKEVSCVSKYATYNGITPKDETLTDTGAGRKCTVKLEYLHNTGLGPRNDTLRMICDYKGDLTYFGK